MNHSGCKSRSREIKSGCCGPNKGLDEGDDSRCHKINGFKIYLGDRAFDTYCWNVHEVGVGKVLRVKCELLDLELEQFSGMEMGKCSRRVVVGRV